MIHPHTAFQNLMFDCKGWKILSIQMNGPFMLTITQRKENAYCKKCSDYVSFECMLMSIVRINREI